MKSVIALGANLGDRESNFVQALDLLDSQIGRISLCSSFYETVPLNHPDNPDLVQPHFLNAVAILATDLDPLTILRRLQDIENIMGRNKSDLLAIKWGPRIIDLDIIAIESLVCNFSDLTIPHPEMHNRSFVLEPLCEIWPNWLHPVLKKTAADLLAQLLQRHSS